MGQGMAPADVPADRGRRAGARRSATPQGPVPPPRLRPLACLPFSSPLSPWSPSVRPATEPPRPASSWPPPSPTTSTSSRRPSGLVAYSALTLILPVVFSHSPEGNVRRVILAFLPRFSLVAGLSVAALIVTGLYSAWAHVDGPSRPRRPLWAGALDKDRPRRCPPGLRSHEPAVADPRHPRRPQGRLSTPPDSHRRGYRRCPRDSRRGIPHEP